MKFFSIGSLLVVESGSATWAALIERLRQSYRQSYAAMYGGNSTHAEKVSIELLRGWLSPSQLEEFDKDSTFTVIGGLSGRAYHISHEMAYNIRPVDGGGIKLCFTPASSYPDITIYDRMLAQKIALENNEEGALRVCNQMPGRGGEHMAYGQSYRPPTETPYG